MSDETPEFEGMIARLLEKLTNVSRNDDGPQSDNPEDYPRAVEITDGDAMMMFEQLAFLQRSGERKLSELRALKYEHDALKTRLFLHLEDLYSHVRSPSACAGTGWRTWRGKTHYVGWDRVERSLKNPSGT